LVKLFKSADERFDQGNEFIKRKEYDKARSAFEKAINKGTSESKVARIMIALLNLRGNPSESAYLNALSILNEDPDMAVDFGLFTIKCCELAIECEACAAELNATAMPSDATNGRADAYFKAAMMFQAKVGENTLIIPEVYTASKVKGITKAGQLMAIGKEIQAESVAKDDPKKAAEFLQEALIYHRQLGNSNAEARVSELIRQYAKAAACWLCGRESTGENINFVAMESEVTPAQSRSKQVSPLPSFEGSASIYVCRACYLAVSKRADAIARQYHEAAMTEMRNMEARINTRINQLNLRVR